MNAPDLVSVREKKSLVNRGKTLGPARSQTGRWIRLSLNDMRRFATLVIVEIIGVIFSTPRSRPNVRPL